ncbi:hypothetical protein T4C_10751 [Trichinella pseudospiralis]|uniref:Uncharacterized protein n=1 Tax=Trichinella pseudospiralis TaxID=6337 RepID=A0A0V1JV60_TRIPS|nr:hypothetical protein T4C_10751 [Trichinella pseudospiralis]
MSQSDQTVVKAFGEEKRRYNEPCQSVISLPSSWQAQQRRIVCIEQTLATGHLVVRWPPFVQWPRGVGDNYVAEINACHGPGAAGLDQLPPFHRLLSARFGQVGTDKSASGQVCVKRKSPARFSFS